MLNLVQWAAILGMATIGVMFLTEVRKWRLLGPIMSRGQRILRALLFITIEALFAMMLIGPSVTSRDPITSLLYWMICLILGLVVVVLALLDLRAVVGQYARLNRQAFRDLKNDDRHEK